MAYCGNWLLEMGLTTVVGLGGIPMIPKTTIPKTDRHTNEIQNILIMTFMDSSRLALLLFNVVNGINDVCHIV